MEFLNTLANTSQKKEEATMAALIFYSNSKLKVTAKGIAKLGLTLGKNNEAPVCVDVATVRDAEGTIGYMIAGRRDGGRPINTDGSFTHKGIYENLSGAKDLVVEITNESEEHLGTTWYKLKPVISIEVAEERMDTVEKVVLEEVSNGYLAELEYSAAQNHESWSNN